MLPLLSNPEFIRNVRGQLRPGKIFSTAAICAALSIATAFSFSRMFGPAVAASQWGSLLLKLTFFVQALVLAAGGGIACLNAIYKEKEQNTFDYQRVTLLTPFELTAGKFFGAPLLAYFTFLCLIPLATFAALKADASPVFVIVAYAVVLAASLSFHALALLISLLTARGSHASSILLLLLLLLGSSVVGFAGPGMFWLGPLSPFWATELVEQRSWHVSREASSGQINDSMTDVFFGYPVHHALVVVLLNLIFAAWFWLALIRNIKRDPNYYELYSPSQALGFILFLNLIFVGFFPWRSASALDAQALLLTLNIAVFFCFGLVSIRNRERTRRILRAKLSGASWLDSLWPAPLLVIGTLLAGAVILIGLAEGRDPGVYWSSGFAIFRLLFFVVWLVRDIQYLQWMSLRRGKHPLVIGVLYQIIFYLCAVIFFSAFSAFSDPDKAPFASFFLPTPVYVLDHSAWLVRPAIWVAAFTVQLASAGIFIFLQRQAIRDLASRAESAPVQVAA